MNLSGINTKFSTRLEYSAGNIISQGGGKLKVVTSVLCLLKTTLVHYHYHMLSFRKLNQTI